MPLTEAGSWQSCCQSGLDVLLRERHGDSWRSAPDEVLVDKDVIVFACHHDRPIVSKRDVVALVVFDGALQRTEKLAAGTEHRQVEVVVIVRNYYLAVRTHADANRIVGHTLAANDSQRSAVVREHLKTKTTSKHFNGSKNLEQCHKQSLQKQ